MDNDMPCNSCDFDPRCADVCQHSSCATGQRSDKDYAIEHGGYLATAATDYLDAINAEWLAEMENEENESEATRDALDDAIETVGDANRRLRTCIYEFEKRRARAISPSPAHAGICEPDPEQRVLRKIVVGEVARSVGARIHNSNKENGEPIWNFTPSQLLEFAEKVWDAASPDVGKAQAPSPLPHDFLTHKDSWREALKLCAERAEDDPDYWEHELRAYDNAHAELSAAIAQSAPRPVLLEATDGVTACPTPEGGWCMREDCRKCHPKASPRKDASGVQGTVGGPVPVPRVGEHNGGDYDTTHRADGVPASDGGER